MANLLLATFNFEPCDSEFAYVVEKQRLPEQITAHRAGAYRTVVLANGGSSSVNAWPGTFTGIL